MVGTGENVDPNYCLDAREEFWTNGKAESQKSREKECFRSEHRDHFHEFFQVLSESDPSKPSHKNKVEINL
jgi:hypothetical protein